MTKKMNTTALIEAIKNDDIKLVKELLKSGADIEAKDEKKNRTALMWALDKNRTEIAKLLIDSGSDIEAKNKKGTTALMFASIKDNVEIAKLLIERGANIEAKTKNKLTALMFTAINNSTNVAKLLIDSGADINKASDYEDEQTYKTSLMYAASHNSKEVAKLLIDNGADIDSDNGPRGENSLMYATMYNSTEVVKLLIDSGANLEEESFQDYTALTFAIFNDNEDIAKLLIAGGVDIKNSLLLIQMPIREEMTMNKKSIKLLIKLGADVNATNEDGKTPLINNTKDTGKILIENGANVHAKDKHGWTALMQAALYDTKDTAKILIEHGVYIEAKTDDGITALMIASKNNSIEIAKLLIEKKADIESKDELERTALSHTSIRDSIDVAKLLIKHGANIHCKAIDETTALSITSMTNSIQVAKLLIENGVDINAKDKNGKTALSLASAYNHIDIAKLLIDNGADINAKDKDGNTALTWASVHNHIDVIKLLIQKKAKVDIRALVQATIYTVEDTSDNKWIKPEQESIITMLKNNKKIIEILLKNTTDIESKNIALSFAVLYDKLEIVQLLLENGANIDYKDDYDDLTPLMLSIIRNNIELTNYLLEQGADFKKRSSIDCQAIDFAYNKPKLRTLLQKKGAKRNPLTKKKQKEIEKFIEEHKLDNNRSSNIISSFNSDMFSRCIRGMLNSDEEYNIENFYQKELNNFENIKNVEYLKEIEQTSHLIEAIKKNNIELAEILIKRGEDIEFVDKDDKTAWDYASEFGKRSKEVLALLENQERLMKPTYDPKQLVKLLSNFTRDTPIKYTTHRWDFGDIDKEHGGFDGFMNKVQKHWDSSIKDDIKNLSSNLYEKIEEFLTLWRATDGLKEWCESGKDPFDFKDFGKKKDTFKQRIEIRTENDALEEMFLEIEESLEDHEIECRKLKGKQFYTDVAQLKLTLKKIFSEIEKRDKHTKIVVEATDTTGKYIELCITHIGSFSHKSAEELLKEVDDGDFADIKKSLQNLCDWSVEDNKHRINYLVSDNSIEEIEELDEKVEGFRHLFRFYG